MASPTLIQLSQSHSNCSPYINLSSIRHVSSSSPRLYPPHLSSTLFNHLSSGLNMFSKDFHCRVPAAIRMIQGKVDAPKIVSKTKQEPDHLLVLVHGILASPSDWTYVEAELKRQLGSNFLIYASSSNTYTKTFTGIDGAGRRLADEVMQVVRSTGSLKRISFLAHSLGGLFARYAVGVLYSSDPLNNGQLDDITSSTNDGSVKPACNPQLGKIAGLEPVNFITLATPHLGVRGKKQLPFLLGVPILEKLAPPIAPFIIGRTGRQLFLTDGKPSRPPLLLRMTSDCEDGKFISSLGAFRCRILYANVSYDRIPPHKSMFLLVDKFF
ncbi:hypothetical protein QJS10_CPB12g00750 [Acorus calamus]|uniref:DUF676 domain-containing protein n=1 Tax=Acorus calamus TaxID=4465 RepID=A0AAV9DLE3_ACOCL|nr:hypothetical protein QJS10_CPB12g00750 [Acorus calamus]